MKEFEKYLFGWSLIKDVGYRRLSTILSHFKDPKVAWFEFGKEGTYIKGFGKKLTEKIKQAINKIDIEKEINNVRKKGIEIITLYSSGYPELLKKISSPPIVLYVLGRLPTGNYISIVGTRRPSSYGIFMAEKISRELVEYGGIVVSGMARGIDAHSHLSAVKNDGYTIAVLGTGVDVVYPREAKRLYKEIIDRGAVISEYPLGTLPIRENFPKRNRIIAGLSLGTLVVEAPLKSGALITAKFAIDEGREVFALPGRIDSNFSSGTNKLIKEGAKLVESAKDIVEEFPYINWERVSKRDNGGVDLSQRELAVYNMIGVEPKHIDEITQNIDFPRGELFSIILSLEFKGLIKEIGGKRYCRER